MIIKGIMQKLQFTKLSDGSDIPAESDKWLWYDDNRDSNQQTQECVSTIGESFYTGQPYN